MDHSELAYKIIKTPLIGKREGDVLGNSRENRPVKAFRLGYGRKNISLLAGCHADEPVGPRLLRHFTSYLKSLKSNDPILSEYTWWIVPHINPDGEARNKSWYSETDKIYDCDHYLENVVREKPGDDIEFGFPRDAHDRQARPEATAVKDWWSCANTPFRLHVSLHGMASAADRGF